MRDVRTFGGKALRKAQVISEKLRIIRYLRNGGWGGA